MNIFFRIMFFYINDQCKKSLILCFLIKVVYLVKSPISQTGFDYFRYFLTFVSPPFFGL